MQKHCSFCQFCRRDRAGPHEWTYRYCDLHQIDFPFCAEHCAFFLPTSADPNANRWPYGQREARNESL